MSRKIKIVITALIALTLTTGGFLSWLVRSNHIEGEASVETPVPPFSLSSELYGWPQYKYNSKGREIRFSLYNNTDHDIPITQRNPWRIIQAIPIKAMPTPPNPLWRYNVIYTPPLERAQSILKPNTSIVYVWNQRDQSGKQVPVGNYEVQFTEISALTVPTLPKLPYKDYDIPNIPFKITPIALSMSASSYYIGQEIQFTLKNVDTTLVTFSSTNPWQILDSTDKVIYHPPSVLTPFTLTAGGSRLWTMVVLGVDGQPLQSGQYKLKILPDYNIADFIFKPYELYGWPQYKENPKGEEVRFFLYNNTDHDIPITQSDPWQIIQRTIKKIPTPLQLQPYFNVIYTPSYIITQYIIKSHRKIMYAWNQRDQNNKLVPLGNYEIQFAKLSAITGPTLPHLPYKDYDIPTIPFKITPVKLSMSASNYNVGQEIQFTIKNVDTTPITFPNADPWEIRDSTNKVVSTPSSTSAPFILPAGASYSRVISPLGANGKVLPAGEYTFIILSSNPDDPYNRARFTIGNEPPISPSTTPTNTPAPAD